MWLGRPAKKKKKCAHRQAGRLFFYCASASCHPHRQARSPLLMPCGGCVGGCDSASPTLTVRPAHRAGQSGHCEPVWGAWRGVLGRGGACCAHPHRFAHPHRHRSTPNQADSMPLWGRKWRGWAQPPPPPIFVPPQHRRPPSAQWVW